jgi:SAM-dependent methyltransferase
VCSSDLREVLLEALQATMPDQEARLLEIGCGAGTVATFLNEHGYHVDYADVHREALELAHARALDRLGPAVTDRSFIRMDVCRTDVPAGYDGFLLLDVIEHLPDDAEVLEKVRAAFAPHAARGLLMITVPAFPFLWSPYDDVERHKRRYTRTSAQRVLEASGFEVQRATYFFSPLFFASGGVKLLRSTRNALRSRPPPDQFTELVETRTSPRVNAAAVKVLGAERRFLRRHDLALGTSLLVIARPR